MGLEGWLPLDRLKRAVKKVRLLLNFDVNRWRIASIIGRSSQRRLSSFNDRLGLQSINDDESDKEVIGISPRKPLQRTISSPRSCDEDIDMKAEMFINNFYNRLRMERQVSLNLRYCRGDSFESERSSN